jgi:predicted nuclease with TOPRIM domain
MPSGINTFQSERTEIVKSLVEQGCKILTEKNIKISANKVTEQVHLLAEKRKIDNKYLVDEQTISRNGVYNNIWKKYKKIQNQKQSNRKSIVSKKFEEFDLRDKHDMLMQDYIELMDEMKFLKSECEKLKQKNPETLNTNLTNIAPDQTNSKIIQAIKVLVNEGPTIIVRKDGKVIVKSHLNDETKRYEFLEKEWKYI